MFLRKLLSVVVAPLLLLAGACASYAPAANAQPIPAQWNYSFDANGNAVATYPGNTKIQGKIISIPAGCDNSGTSDASTCLNNYLAALGTTGGTIQLTGVYLVNATLNVPVGVSLQGNCTMPGTQGSNSSTPYSNYSCGVIRLASSATISLGAGSNLSKVIVYRAGMTFPAADASLYAGTAVTIAGDDASVYQALIIGFNKAIYSNGYQRLRVQNLFADNNNGVEITSAADIPRIDDSHFWPFGTIANGGAASTNERSGYAIYLHDTVDWAHLTDDFSYGYFRGILLSNVNSTSIIGGGADNVYSAGAPQYTGSIGLVVQGSSADTRVIGFQAAAQAAAGVYVNATGTTSLSDTTVWGGSTHAIQIDGGDAVIQGGLLGTNNGIVNGVTVNNVSSHVLINGVHFGTLTGNPINVAAANNNTIVDTNDFGPYNGAVAGTNYTVPSIASAAVVALPNTGKLFNITGTTNFGTLNYGWAGRCVTLVFGSAITVLNSTGAYGAMHLNAGANFVAAANDNLTLCHNGVQWYETAQSH